MNRVDNNLGARIPSALTRAAKLRASQTVCISAMTPLDYAPLTLAQRLAAFDPAIHGGEVMASIPADAEML
jgi:antitoxin MazE